MGIQTTEYTTGSGTFTVPADLIGTTIDIELWGGGGGGGSSSSSSLCGSGAGGGGYCKKTLTVSPSDTIAYVVGAAGTGSTIGNNDAANGGNSSVASTYFANGGGAGGSAGFGNIGGTGGTASGGDYNHTGNTGWYCTTSVGGSGGAAPTGPGWSTGLGGSSNAGNPTPAATTSPGDGGGGAGFSSTAVAGGNGGAGKIKFTYTAPVVYTETPTGGISVGGSATLTTISPVTLTGGGIAFGGSAGITFGKDLIPTANQSFSSGTVTYYGGSTNYTNLFDSSDSTYFQLTGGDAYASYPLTDTPSNLNAVTAVTITIKGLRANKGDYASLDYVQIFKSDGSTAITSSATATLTTTATTYNITPSTINYSDKTSWDGAVLKIKQNYGTGGGITIYEAKVAITYTLTGGEVYNNTMSGGIVVGASAVVGVARFFTPTGGIAFGSTATTTTDIVIDSTGEGIVFGSTATVTSAMVESTTGEGIAFAGEADVTDEFMLITQGGITFGGDAQIDPFIPTGGIRFGGVGSNDFNYTPSGGMRFGGQPDIVFDLNWTMNGGIAFAGLATTATNGEQIAEGGIVFGGDDVEYGIDYVESMNGGIEFGGDTDVEISIGVTGEGFQFGGGADIAFDFASTMQGGIVFGDGYFTNDKKYRMFWSVPSDYINKNTYSFLLPLPFDLPRVIDTDSLRIEDTEGNVIKHEAVHHSGNRVVAIVRRDLLTSADTSGYVYYGD